MANEFVARNGIIALNNVQVTGSLSVTNGITGSLSGSAISSSYAATASLTTTASFASTASYINPLNQNVSINGTESVTGSIAISGSTGNVLSANADILAITGSLLVTGSSAITGSLAVSGSAGSTLFTSNVDSLILTGSLFVTGSSYFTGSVNISGSLNATASQALTASYVANASSFPFTGSAIITGSLVVTGSATVTGTLTATASYASYALTASYVSGSSSVSASYAATASYVAFALSASSAPGYTINFTQATPALTWSFLHNLNTRNPIVQVYDTGYNQILPNAVIGIDANNAQIRFDYAQSGYAVLSNGGGLYVTGSTSLLSQSSAAVTWSFTHNLNSKYINFTVYDSSDNVMVPLGIKALTSNYAEIYFSTARTGVAVAQFSGINGASNANTASYALVATSASYATNTTTASYAVNATTASYAVNATTASYAINSTTASYALVATSASYATSASQATSASVAITSSYAINSTTASYAINSTTASYAVNTTTASYAVNSTTASYAVNTTTAATASFANTFTVANTLTAQTIVVNTITSSVDYITGSSINGSLLGNTHQFTGSILATGSAVFTNSMYAGGYYASGSTTIGMPFDTGGTKAYFDGSSINGPALSLVSDAVGRTIRMAATTGSTYVGVVDVNTTKMSVGTNTALPLTFTYNASEVMRITGSYVGIGTTTPKASLEIAGLSSTNIRIFGITGITENGITSNVYWNGSSWLHDSAAISSSAIRLGQGGDILFNTDNSTSGFPAERMRIISTGNVGIGTTTPSSRLEVAGGSLTTNNSVYVIAQAAGLTTGRLSSYASGTAAAIHTYFDAATLELSAGSSNGYVAGVVMHGLSAATGSGQVRIFTSSTERITVTSGGFTGFGTTSPTTILNIQNSSGNNIVTTGFTNNADDIGMLQVWATGANTNGASVTVKNYYGTGQLFQWSSNGMRIGNRLITNGGTGDVYLTAGADTTTMILKATGTVTPGANGTQDFGSTSLRWATIYTSDLDMSNGIGDYTIVEGEEDLFLYNNKTNKVFKFVIQEVDPSIATPKMKK